MNEHSLSGWKEVTCLLGQQVENLPGVKTFQPITYPGISKS